MVFTRNDVHRNVPVHRVLIWYSPQCVLSHLLLSTTDSLRRCWLLMNTDIFMVPIVIPSGQGLGMVGRECAMVPETRQEIYGFDQEECIASCCFLLLYGQKAFHAKGFRFGDEFFHSPFYYLWLVFIWMCVCVLCCAHNIDNILLVNIYRIDQNLLILVCLFSVGWLCLCIFCRISQCWWY